MNMNHLNLEKLTIKNNIRKQGNNHHLISFQKECKFKKQNSLIKNKFLLLFMK